ncbi:hypothetical protein BpHYR1_047460 [Brachionus plicatilis]|uniref:Uncharacterized protein n=1 Tax=Brachionus plicatilis TaxID=10195 RepID=A0A3M7QBE8_BRAPC|nr:hypothetical protein BpHYR1_047460 [Brachionus plicatilis]
MSIDLIPSLRKSIYSFDLLCFCLKFYLPFLPIITSLFIYLSIELASFLGEIDDASISFAIYCPNHSNRNSNFFMPLNLIRTLVHSDLPEVRCLNNEPSPHCI